MKVTARWELTTVINRELKKLKRKIDREAYLRMLRETQEYTLLQRVASELYRAGVSSTKFFAELHKDDWTLSNRVMEELERIEKGRNGYDPDRVPSILPVYLVPASPAQVEEAIRFKGRPQRKLAAAEATRWVKSLLLMGWTEGDVNRAIQDVLDDEDDSTIVVVKADEDLSAEKPKVHTKLKYYVHDGQDWQIYASPVKAKEALATLKDQVMGNIRRAEPMPDITARICAECKQPLNGHVMTIRGPKEKGKNKRSVVEHLHSNCYWLKRIEPCRIPVGMELICPSDGKPYVWVGPDKGGWKLKHEPEAESQAPAISGNGANGVPQPSSQQPAAVVPTAPSPVGPVHQVQPTK